MTRRIVGAVRTMRPTSRFCFAGIDVGGRRKGFHVAVIHEGCVLAGPARLGTPDDAVGWLRGFAPSVIGVDAPREPASDGAVSRECERRIARDICGIRYTPDLRTLRSATYYAWVLHGLELYAALAGDDWEVVETFPTACWTRWAGPRGDRPRGAWSGDALARLIPVSGRPARLGQDGRDAIGAALVAREHFAGRTDPAFAPIAVPAATPRA